MSSVASRVGALDAVRGLAVLGMVLSGSIGFGGQLPAWMYHAQVPPPLHRYDAAKALTLPGITWVDLVFPAFLFAMGAAIPLACRGLSWAEAHWSVMRRGALLLGFAVLTEHMKAVHLAASPQPLWAHSLSVLAFVFLGVVLTRNSPPWARVLAAAALVGFLFVLPFADGRGFRPQRQDIILVVLANMALFSGLLWLATRSWPAARWATCVAVVAIIISPKDAWTRSLLDSSPAAWAYQFAYLKYLLILVPGVTVGEWLAAHQARAAAGDPSSSCLRTLSALALLVVLVNLYCLYTRSLLLGFTLSAALCSFGLWRLGRLHNMPLWISSTWRLASLLLIMGLFMEPWQGGIRKDPSTFSYQIVGAALSAMLLIALQGVMASTRTVLSWIGYALRETGQNPLLAYVAGSLLVLPLLQLSGLHDAWSGLNTSAPTALLKGVLFTAAVLGVTLFANYKRWVWRI